jgi:hypothetical protein
LLTCLLISGRISGEDNAASPDASVLPDKACKVIENLLCNKYTARPQPKKKKKEKKRENKEKKNKK